MNNTMNPSPRLKIGGGKNHAKNAMGRAIGGLLRSRDRRKVRVWELRGTRSRREHTRKAAGIGEALREGNRGQTEKPKVDLEKDEWSKVNRGGYQDMDERKADRIMTWAKRRKSVRDRDGNKPLQPNPGGMKEASMLERALIKNVTGLKTDNGGDCLTKANTKLGSNGGRDK